MARYDVTSRTTPTAVLIIHNPIPMEKEQADREAEIVKSRGYNNVKIRKYVEKEDDD